MLKRVGNKAKLVKICKKKKHELAGLHAVHRTSSIGLFSPELIVICGLPLWLCHLDGNLNIIFLLTPSL